MKVTRITQKAIALILIFIMAMARITYAIDMFATNVDNVEFRAYFKLQEEDVTEISKSINAEDLKLKIDVAVKNEGYFNGQISLENAGFIIKEDSKNEYINKIENNVIYLKQINAEEIAEIEVGIKYMWSSEIALSTLNNQTKIKLTGNYTYSKGNKEINGESEVKVNWTTPEDAKSLLDAKLLTNSVYTVEESKKRVIQILVASKVSENSYPVKNTQIQMQVPEGAENVTVHKRYTTATNGNKEFTGDNYNVENGILSINVKNSEQDGKIAWQRNAQDTYVVTCEFTENIDLSETDIKIKARTIMQDEKILESEEKKVKIDKELDGKITIAEKTQEEEMYKGKIYAGEQRDFITYTRVFIDYAKGAEEVNFEQNETYFVEEQQDDDGNKKEEKNNANVVYKSIKLNKDNISRVLGETWNISIEDQNKNVKAITNETEVDENGNIFVELDEEVKKFNVTTSKPQNDGIIDVEMTRTILKQEYTREQIKDFSKMTDEKVEIDLVETESKASLEVEPTTFVGGQKHQTKMEVVLESDNEQRDLYKNPIVKLALPKQINSLANADCRLLYGNGLEIEGTSSNKDERSITIKLKGEQKNYDGEAIKGATLVITAEVGIDENAQDSEEEIKLNYLNENATIYADKGKQKVKVNIIAAPKAQDENQSQNNTQENTQGQNNIQIQENAITSKVRSSANLQQSPAQISAELTAEVGGQKINEGDEVKAGEIITYTAIVSNNGTQNIEGLNITATIPENTTLSIINENQWLDYEYDIGCYLEKEDKQIVKENVTIEAGKSVTYLYKVKVNGDISDTITEEMRVSINYQNSELVTKTLSNKLVKASIEAKVILLVTNQGKIKSGYDYEYKFEIYNKTDEEQRNLKIMINKNDLVNIKNIYTKSEGTNQELDKDNLTIAIDSIAAKEIKSIYVKALIASPTENTNEAEIYATIEDSESNKYRTNKISIETEGVDIKATLVASSELDKQYVSEGEKIKYTIKVDNVGSINADHLKIEDRFSDYLELEKILLNGEECEYDQIDEYGEDKKYNRLVIENPLNIGESITIEIIGKVKELSFNTDIKIINKALVYNDIIVAETEEQVFTLEVEEKNQEEDNNENNNDNNQNLNYTISGIIWEDTNKNGSRDENEKLLSGIKVYAIKTSDSKIAMDSNGKEISASTNDKGVYTLNLTKGEYIVVFEYNIQKYVVTDYQAKGVSSNKNSDAVKATRVVNDQQKTVAVTDSIDLKNNITNIDLGLVEAKNFNLELEKVITRITVTNGDKTKTYKFKDTNLAKIEIAGKNLNKSNVMIEYKIKVKNTGDIAGYAKSIVDYIPSSLTFNSSLNSSWYKKGDNLYSSALANTKIEPGETKEIKLILTKKMTESNTGLVNNKAEIEKLYNDSGIDVSSSEDSKGSADTIIGIRTGVAAEHIIITLAIVAVICEMAYLVYKEILIKRKIL